MMNKKELFDNLTKILPRDRLGCTPIELLSYGYDGTRRIALPDAVARVKDTAEVSSILQFAYANGVPVVPRGAATNLTGGALALHGGIALDFTLMNKLISIDSENLTATVEAGVVVADLQREVERRGLFYPPDPASNEFSTIGGNIAEGAGGIRGLKYGVTRDFVLGLEAVAADGTIFHTGVVTMKSVTGYDLTRLLVGSEGTLAVFTRATLKLLPMPPAVGVARVFFANDRAALSAASLIVNSRMLPRALEFVDCNCLAVIREAGVHIPSNEGESMLLVEFDGTTQTVATELQSLKALLAPHCVRFDSTDDPKERESLWAVRKSISPSVYKIAGKKISEDICVPRSKLAETLDLLKALEARYSIRTLAYGHAGDGNLHVNFLLTDGTEHELEQAEQAVADLFVATIAFGGTLTGEHGIGITKQRYLPLEVQPYEMNLMRELKRVFDPKGILNPGKIFPAN